VSHWAQPTTPAATAAATISKLILDIKEILSLGPIGRPESIPGRWRRLSEPTSHRLGSPRTLSIIGHHPGPNEPNRPGLDPARPTRRVGQSLPA
jgi:hypothetical protein